mmetsp:Transcript_26136/g.23132  ORF Transcript_26136/g.23132 Transcript_26136/m.23132 type:complete len:85 (+) Transcript_26136:1399-1653(+)
MEESKTSHKNILKQDNDHLTFSSHTNLKMKNKKANSKFKKQKYHLKYDKNLSSKKTILLSEDIRKFNLQEKSIFEEGKSSLSSL